MDIPESLAAESTPHRRNHMTPEGREAIRQNARKGRESMRRRAQAVHTHPGDTRGGKELFDLGPLAGLDLAKEGITLRAAKFAITYINNGFSAAGAYRAIFPNTKEYRAIAQGRTFLRTQECQKAIDLYMHGWMEDKRTELQRELVDTLWAMAFYDPGRIINPDGTPAFRSWDELPLTLRRCVEGVQLQFFGKNADRSVISVKLARRDKALTALAGYMSLMNTAPGKQDPATTLSPDTELLLNQVFQDGRKVDREAARHKGVGGRSGISPEEQLAQSAAPAFDVVRGIG